MRIQIATTILGMSVSLILLAKDALAFTVMPSISSPSFSKSSQYSAQFASVTDTDSDSDLLQGCLDKLEKRIKGGPGALSDSEVAELKDAMSQIAESLDSAPPKHDYDETQLRSAVVDLNTTAVSAMLEAGLKMDKETTDAAFWAVVKSIDDAEEQDKALSADVPRMIHHIFDADMEQLLERYDDTITTNLTCMQPDESVDLSSHKMAYIFDDSSHKDLPLAEGRRCEDGDCCDACSRNVFPTFALDSETDRETFPGLNALTFNKVYGVSTGTILQFVRLIERVRRTMSYEYGVPLKSLLPLQAYSRKYVAGSTQQGGGGGEGDFVTLHTDESTHAGYHYSCVIYLSTQGEDFEGGDFVFNDPAPKAEKTDGDANSKTAEGDSDDDEVPDELLAALARGELPDDIPWLDDVEDEEDLAKGDDYYESLNDEIRSAGRILNPYHPKKGAAVIFTSGWENMHEVEKITSGVRFAVPAFFTTCPVPEMAYEQMAVGKPKSDDDIADDWLHLLFANRKQSPMESAGRVRELLMKWHCLCAPLNEH